MCRSFILPNIVLISCFTDFFRACGGRGCIDGYMGWVFFAIKLAEQSIYPYWRGAFFCFFYPIHI